MTERTPLSAPSAAALLWDLWQSGSVVDALPSGCRPSSRSEGYAAQAQLPAVSGREVVGWKVAATSIAGQRHIAVDGPLAGRLLSGQVAEDGASISLAGNRMRVAEPEFCFRMAVALPPRSYPYSLDEVLAAVGGLHPAIEVPDSRYADFARAGEAQLLADDACAWRFVLGPAAPVDWRGVDLAAHPVRARVAPRDGAAWEREGSGANVLADPRLALAWLANELSALGIGLSAGQSVTTGTCMTPLEIAPGDAVVADFGLLGRVSARFTE
jgi:2-keto-4-pentenoate hydratase